MLCDIVVFDGVDELDAIGPLEVLRRAGSRLTTRLVTRVPGTTIVGSVGLRFQPDDVWRPGRADVLIVPGGGWVARAATGAWAEHLSGEWSHPLRAAREGSELVAGVCTGSMLLAHAGVMDGRRGATHQGAQAELADLGVNVITDRVVDDGDLITCGGVTSGVDLGLWLVERLVSRAKADEIADALEYNRFRPTV